jgi:D-alanyl-D-alanine carboxypeptidase
LSAIERINARIVQIQTQFAALAPPPAVIANAPATSNTSFAAALSSATVASNGNTKLNADGIPASLAAYGNGKIPENALSSVGGTRHRLWEPAAQSLETLISAARRDGVTIGITDSYRPYTEQVDLVRRKGLYSNGGLAAKPGTSDHGWGMAADLNLNAKAQTWMRANGPRFGFHEDTPREPWHWGYKPPA